MDKSSKATYILLSLAIALLAAGLIAFGVAEAQGPTEWCVTNAPELTNALAGAASGDVIQVITRTVMTGNFVIDKSLTLAGGYSDDCAYRVDYANSHIDADHTGRALTINPLTSGVHVIVEQLYLVNGDASGLGGGPDVSSLPSFEPPDSGWPPDDGVPPLPLQSAGDTAVEPGDLEAKLAELNAPGVFPGGEGTYQAWKDHLNALLHLETTPLGALTVQPDAPKAADAPQAPDAEVDCGGGVYIKNAEVELSGVIIEQNTASTTGIGFGGGLCAVNLPAGGLSIFGDTQFIHNTASTGDSETFGVGGAIFVDAGDTATVELEDVTALANIASRFGIGRGGAFAIWYSPDVKINSPALAWNLAGRSPDVQNASEGGGIHLYSCPDSSITNARIFDNIADAGGGIGGGGGIYIEKSDRALVHDNVIGRNTGHANTGLIGPKGVGGGILIYDSQDVQFYKNTLYFNMASLYAQGFGGGMYAAKANNLLVEENKIEDNVAAYFQNGNQYGGGVFVVESADWQVLNNAIKRNMAGSWSVRDYLGFGPGGGGMAVDLCEYGKISGNDFEENTAFLSGVGHGGGLTVGGTSSFIEISENIFHNNTAVRQDEVDRNSIGEGAGIVVDIAHDISILRNLFTNNAGSLGAYEGSVIMVSGFIAGSDELGSANILIDGNRILDSGANMLPNLDVFTKGIRVQLTESTIIVNNVIAGTQGPGIALEWNLVASNNRETHALVANNTLVDNRVCGLQLSGNWDSNPPDGSITVVNNVFTDHGVGIQSDSNFQITVDHNLFFDNLNNLDGYLAETNTVASDPKFTNAAEHNYALLWGSPAIDSGMSRTAPSGADLAYASPIPNHDLNLIHRPSGRGVDIGAYELLQIFLIPIYR